MGKVFIDGGEYNQLLEATRYSDSTKFDANSIIGIFEYLKDKRTDERKYDGSTIFIENAHLDFLQTALDRIYNMPKYNQGTEGFLKSDYLSNELKKEIYNVLNGNCCSNQILALLTGTRPMCDFSKDEIKAIEDFLRKTYEALAEGTEKEKCGDILNLFEHYFFAIDGEGPTGYIKEKNGSELPTIILEKSGVPSYPSYYSGYGVDRRYLGEEHLFSIYKKLVKYYPDKAEEFIQLVRSISRLTPTEFVTNYLSFVSNGLNNNFNYKNGNISVDGVPESARDLIGAVSLLTLFCGEQKGFDSYEREEHFFIKNSFFQMVEQFKSTHDLELSENQGLSRKKDQE